VPQAKLTVDGRSKEQDPGVCARRVDVRTGRPLGDLIGRAAEKALGEGLHELVE